MKKNSYLFFTIPLICIFLYIFIYQYGNPLATINEMFKGEYFFNEIIQSLLLIIMCSLLFSSFVNFIINKKGQ